LYVLLGYCVRQHWQCYLAVKGVQGPPGGYGYLLAKLPYFFIILVIHTEKGYARKHTPLATPLCKQNIPHWGSYGGYGVYPGGVYPIVLSYSRSVNPNYALDTFFLDMCGVSYYYNYEELHFTSECPHKPIYIYINGQYSARKCRNSHLFQGQSMNLLAQQHKKRELTPQQCTFLDVLFENGGNVTEAALAAGYSRGSTTWLKDTLADEIIQRTKNILSVNALKAANRLVTTIDNPVPDRGDDLRLRAAESLLNRVGVAKQETMNHNVQAIHGVVLLPPKKEMVIDG
jgi:hypothetical protein